MLIAPSPTFLEICAGLRVKRGYGFEVICNDYLKARFPNLTPWISTKAEWTYSGTPDAFVLDDKGNLIACQYGSQENWHKKLLDDAEKVKKLATENSLAVSKLIFCTTSEIDLVERAGAESEVKDRHGFPAEVCDLMRLADDLEKLYPGIAFRRFGIPIRLQPFITLDAYLDSLNPRYWPKRKDVERGRLYWPETYFKEIERKLLEKRRCLLSGISGSGKTALGIAFSLWWRSSEESNRKHPEAVVFYLEVSPGNREETGERWYQQVLAYDYQNELYLIDNCHLAPAAVNAFCYQWERRQPEKASVLLISAPKVSKSPWEEEVEAYFDGFEQSSGVVPVQPEQIYEGVLKAYSDAYRQIAPNRFVPVELDLEDPDRSAYLERVCAHNLVEAHSLLEAWEDVGGRLSDVTEEAALDGLANRYLTQQKAPALVPLCGLEQFEIPAHDRFVSQLPRESVQVLRRENLITVEDSLLYGRCHRVNLHKQTASQIFRAYIRRQVGAGYQSLIDREAFSLLKTYLSTSPENFQKVYHRLYRVGALELQQCLLKDAELQTSAVRQFSDRPLNEAIIYLYALYRINQKGAQACLRDFINGIILEKTLQRRVRELSGVQFFATFNCLPRMNLDIARMVLGDLPAPWVADRLTFLSLPSIEEWIGRLSVKLGYSPAWRRQFAEALDPEVLAVRARVTSLQHLYWTLRYLRTLTPEQASCVLTHITPPGLAKMFREQGATVGNLLDFYKVCDRDFMQSFLRELGDQEIIIIFRRSRLGEIGSLLEWRFRHFEGPYSIFATRSFLRDKLATEEISEIGKFIARLQRIPKEGERLTAQALKLLWKTDLVDRLALTDAEPLALLLLNAHPVDPTYSERILDTLTSNRGVDGVLKRSSIRAIQLLLHNVSELAPAFLPKIGQSLRTVDLSDQIAVANVKDLGHFLWNVRGCDVELAQNYCQIVDAQLRSEQIASADPVELAGFLWNLVHISDLEVLQTLSKPALQERLHNEWKLHPGPCAQILGILVMVRPDATRDFTLPTLSLDQMSEMLAEWLIRLVNERHPYAFALTMKGLRVLHECRATEIVQNAIHQKSAIDKCLELLREAKEQCVTPRSGAVLQEAIVFIQQVRVTSGL